MPGEDDQRHSFPQPGDTVRVRSGTFAGMEGKVTVIDNARRCARVLMNIYGRSVLQEIGYAEIEPRTS